MNRILLGRTKFSATLAAFIMLAPLAQSAGKYTLAYWREAGAYENQAPPSGGSGNHSAFVHIWDDTGQPLSGKQIYTSWGVLLGATDDNGFVEIVLNRPHGYDFQIHDGSHQTDTTPVLSVERAPTWGHYSFEIGFMFKRDAANPGIFDTNYYGVINATGSDPCRDLSAPCTRSLAYYSTCPTNYCSDQYALGNWAASHSQSFVATGNRVLAVRAMMAAGYLVHYYWTAQILEGGPNGTPIGLARSTRNFVDGEYYPILVKWGTNDVQVVPGRTYYVRISAPGGLNAWRLNRDNYPNGNYFENEVSVPGSELMGFVLCGTFTNSGASGALTGFVRDTNGNALASAEVRVNGPELYSTTASDGSYTIPSIPVGTYDVTAVKAGYVSSLNAGVQISSGLTATSSFTLLVLVTNSGSGIVTNGASILQPFESAPAWNSTFDASWGSAATFSITAGGHEGNALQAARSGPGSSARVQVFPLRTNTPYTISIWIRCQSATSPYWVETAYKFGSATAADFDGNSGTWTLLKKFSDTGINGNTNIGTRYSATFSNAANTQISIGFKHGASTGTGPTVQWDQLAIISLTLPGLRSAIANSPSNVVVQFTEPVDDTAATNTGNYTLQSGGNFLAVTRATFLNATNIALTTAQPADHTDYVLTVSNVTTLLQTGSVTGRNGQKELRVPVTLIDLKRDYLWFYNQDGTNMGTTWRGTDVNDGYWCSGPAPFGYYSLPLPDPIQTQFTYGYEKTTFYFRKWFVLPESVINNSYLRLRWLVDDGAVFYLNGNELCRIGITNNPVMYTNLASRVVGAAVWEGPFDFGPISLSSRTNLLAVEVHQYNRGGEDTVFAATLEALVQPSQVPVIDSTIGITNNPNGTITLNWSDKLSTLETATNITGPWIRWFGYNSPLVLRPTNSFRFFRLK